MRPLDLDITLKALTTSRAGPQRGMLAKIVHKAMPMMECNAHVIGGVYAHQEQNL